MSFSILSDFITNTLDFFMLITYLNADVWSQVDFYMATNDFCMSTPLRQDMAHAVLFSILLSLLGQVIQTPFSIYKTFVIEEKYGFNKTTAKTFVMDIVKQTFLMIVFTALLTPLVLWVVDIAGDNLVIGLASVSFAIILLF